MKIVKTLNNNMVLVKTDGGKEQICQGKGLGFGRKAGDRLPAELVERYFVLSDQKDKRDFTSLFSQISDEYFTIAAQTLQYAREKLGIKVEDKVVLPLSDHMAGSVDRYQKGIVLQNPMLWDIQHIYPAEFQAGSYALQLMNEKFHITMKEDEAAFLAWHFVSAELGKQQEVSVNEVTQLISDIIRMVQDSFQIELDENQWDYQRFVTHLKFFSHRVLTRQQQEDMSDTELYEELSQRYRHVNNCVNRIADRILIDYHYEISTDEKLYLLIHVQRVTKRYRKTRVEKKV